jgi:hypothetical protein
MSPAPWQRPCPAQHRQSPLRCPRSPDSRNIRLMHEHCSGMFRGTAAANVRSAPAERSGDPRRASPSRCQVAVAGLDQALPRRSLQQKPGGAQAEGGSGGRATAYRGVGRRPNRCRPLPLPSSGPGRESTRGALLSGRLPTTSATMMIMTHPPIKAAGPRPAGARHRAWPVHL